MFEISDLQFSYGTNIVFDKFSFNIDKGNILCIVGKNGCGKTTLLKILCGLNYCHQFNCKLDDSFISQNELKKYVTYIPAAPNFYENLTAEEYIFWIKTLWKKDKSYIKRVYKYMDLLHLDVDNNFEISTFSLGMKYKLYFCAFLSLESSILLLDEPLNSLDNDSRDLAISLLKSYVKQYNAYCLFSSHVKDTIYSLADKIITI